MSKENRPYLFICWAPKSDVGKDELAKILNSIIPTNMIKFSRAFKTPLEDWLCIPRGSLDDKAFRLTKVINPVTEEEELFTHNDLMYDFFHKFKDLYPGGSGKNWFVPGGTKTTINNTQGNIAVVDVRSQTEIELLKKFQDKYRIILLHIEAKDRGDQKSTDKDLSVEDFLSFIPTENYFIIQNGKEINLEQLKNQVQNVVDKLTNIYSI